MTKDMAKGYCGYAIARLGIRTDDERLSLMGEIGIILNKMYPTNYLSSNLDDEYDKITVKTVKNILRNVLEMRYPNLVEIPNFEYIIASGFINLKCPEHYYKRDMWLNKRAWQHECDDLIDRGLSMSEIIGEMQEVLSLKEVTLSVIKRYLNLRGVVE